MPRNPDPKNAYLELHDGYYRVTMGVPLALQSQLGKRLKQSLFTKSLLSANSLKQPVVQEFKDRIQKAWDNIGGRRRSTLIEAKAWARVMAEVGRPSDPCHEIYAQFLRERQSDILAVGARYETFVDETGEVVEIEIFTDSAQKIADQFGDIVRGAATPIAAHHEVFLSSLRIKQRSLADDIRILGVFAEWCRDNDVPPYIEHVDHETAVSFRKYIELHLKLSWASTNKYLGRLSVYWNYLVDSSNAVSNPWVSSRPGHLEAKTGTEERAFSDAEVQVLLMGNSDRGMIDVMLVAALTGARLDEVVDLAVGECSNGWFTFKPSIRERASREVPIHPYLKAIVAARVKGKAPNDDFFPEWPKPKSKGIMRERSAYFSKRFTEYRRSVGVDEQIEGKRRSLVNFHSFRRWFIGQMERAGVDSGLTAAMVGHKGACLSVRRYSACPETEAAKRAIAKVKLPSLEGSLVLQTPALTSRRR